VGLAIGIFTLAVAGRVSAQDDLDRGKSGAQLYASDCAICHKSPQKLDLGNTGGIFGLDSFLREHYTASRESAAAVAAYLRSVQQAAPATPARRRVRKPSAKGDQKGKPAAAKPVERKSGQKKPKPAASAKPKSAE